MEFGGRRMSECRCGHSACGDCEIVHASEGGLTWICCVCNKPVWHSYSDNE